MDTRLVTLENERLHISVLPDVGAKIFDLVHRPSGYNFLWHNPRIGPQPYPIESNFDNYWCGGWDEGFPTCEACSYKGENYPNLGELRSVHWEVLPSDKTGSSMTLAAYGPISPVRAEKTIRLCEDSVEVSFRVENIGGIPLDFLWGSHPALAIEPGCILHIPAATGIVAQANHPALGMVGQTYDWPIVQTPTGALDMSVVPPAGVSAAGHYAVDLRAGWYAVEYPGRHIGILFEFPLALCPNLWLWLSYGGWRGYYLAVIEPWTSRPVTLSEAVEANTHRTISPGDIFSCAIRATPWARPSTLNDALMARESERE